MTDDLGYLQDGYPDRSPMEALIESFELLRQRFGPSNPSIRQFRAPKGSALSMLQSFFQLNYAEVELLALAAAVELDPSVRDIMQERGGTGTLNTGLAADLFGAEAWTTLCPGAPLRYWRLIESVAGAGHDTSFRIDERILQFLLANVYFDSRIDGILRDVSLRLHDTSGIEEPAQRLIDSWASPVSPRPLVLLSGANAPEKRAVFAQAAEALSLRACRVDAADLPVDWAQRATLARLLDRELVLTSAALLLDCGDNTEESIAERASAFANTLSGPTVISARDPVLPEREPRLRIDLPKAKRRERRALWRAVIGDDADAFGPLIDRMSLQFSLDRVAITTAASLAPKTKNEDDTERGRRLWQAAREQGRLRLDGLAERLTSQAGWDDLVLPADQSETLHDLAGHLHSVWRVLEDWGWAEKNSRGLGAAALFSGPSGTGKTLAAEVLAAQLDLDLYRIDLSQVVSKYIGETEKNLARIFDAAEDAGAILLFDEADALFGKRSEVKDSHDRYANVEVSYLLQRMEAYRGLAVLTTNMKSAVDTAFLRRLRYVVVFPFPDAAARAEIWARVLPEKTPREGLDFGKLSRLSLSGGSIRSVALNAAFLASGQDEPLRMTHILRATRREYTKLEKPFTPTEMEAFR